MLRRRPKSSSVSSRVGLARLVNSSISCRQVKSKLETRLTNIDPICAKKEKKLNELAGRCWEKEENQFLKPEGKRMNRILSKLRCKIGRGPSCAGGGPCRWPPLPAGGAIASRVPGGRNPPGLLLCGVMLPSVPGTENGWPIPRWRNSPKNTTAAFKNKFFVQEIIIVSGWWKRFTTGR